MRKTYHTTSLLLHSIEGAIIESSSTEVEAPPIMASVQVVKVIVGSRCDGNMLCPWQN